MRAVEMSLSGWGRCPVQRCMAFRPERWREVREIIASGASRTIAVRGGGRSYGDAALNEGDGVLSTTRLGRLLDFDETTGVVECESGVTFDDLLGTFVPRGYFPFVTPGTKFVTVGGAVASDVHGKNHHRDGSFGSHVLAMTLLDSNGNLVNCSRDTNKELFFATLGGMGLTGMILTVRFRMKRIASSYVLVDYDRAATLNELLDRFTEDDARYEHSVAWIDCLSAGSKLGRSVLMRANSAHPDDLPSRLRGEKLRAHPGAKLSVPFSVPVSFLNEKFARQFNDVYFQRHGARVGSPEHYDSFFYPLDAIGNWNRLYGRRGFWQYQIVLDRDAGLEGISTMLDRLHRSSHCCLLAVVKAFGESSGGVLSFPKPGYTLSMDIPNRRGSRDFIIQLEGIVRDHGGRAYLAKDACMTAEGFRQMYPSAAEFERVKAQVDPQGRFSSSLARRIGLG